MEFDDDGEMFFTCPKCNIVYKGDDADDKFTWIKTKCECGHGKGCDDCGYDCCFDCEEVCKDEDGWSEPDSDEEDDDDEQSDSDEESDSD